MVAKMLNTPVFHTTVSLATGPTMRLLILTCVVAVTFSAQLHPRPGHGTALQHGMIPVQQSSQTPQMRRQGCLAISVDLKMATYVVNNLQVHSVRVFGYFAPKLKWGNMCLAISGSYLK